MLPSSQVMAEVEAVPYVTAYYSKALAPDSVLVNATESLSFHRSDRNEGDDKITALLNKFVDGQWELERVFDQLCVDCVEQGWTIGSSVYLQKIFDRTLQQDRTFLLGRSGDGSWASTEILLDFTSYLTTRTVLLDNLVVYEGFDSESQTNFTRYWELLDNGIWQRTDESAFPQEALNEELSYNTRIAGQRNDFVMSVQDKGLLIHFTQAASGGWSSKTIKPDDTVQQDSIASPDIVGDTLMVFALHQDLDLPNQGAVHFYTRANNNWVYDDMVPSVTGVISQSTRLLSAEVALIEKRLFERQSDGSWAQSAGLNTSELIKNAYLRDGLLSYHTADSVNFSDWKASPVCTEISSSGVGVLVNTPCTLLPVPQSIGAFGDLLARPPAGVLNASVQATDTQSNTARFFAREGRGLYEFEFDAVSQNMAKVQLPVCTDNADCRLDSFAYDNETVVVATYGSMSFEPTGIEFYTQAADGNWSTQTVSLTGTSADQISSVQSLAVQGNTAVITALVNKVGEGVDLILYVLERDSSGQWTIQHTVKDSETSGILLTYYAPLQIEAGRIIVGGDRSKFQILNNANDGNLYYETTIKPDYRQNGAYGSPLWANNTFKDTIIVGGNHAYGSSVGEAFIFRRKDDGEWVLVQELKNSESSESSFGQQVFINEKYAVVMSLREAEDSYDFEPVYSIFKKQSDDSWFLNKRIVHTANFGINCVDCQFQIDMVWPARLINDHLFLPVATNLDEEAIDAVGCSGCNSLVGDTELLYNVYDLSTGVTLLDVSATGTGTGLSGTNTDGEDVTDTTSDGAQGDTNALGEIDVVTQPQSGGGGAMVFMWVFFLPFLRRVKIRVVSSVG